MNTQYTRTVIPGVLEKEWAEIERKINIIRTFSNRIHIDFIDGKLFSNFTFLDPAPFSKFSRELYLEAHLMVEEPISYLTDFSKAGFKKIIGHIEKMGSQEEFVAQGELLGEIGLALDLDTSIEKITVPFEDLDFILLMTIHAGFSGQNFEQSSLEKIKTLKGRTITPIEVDGGINEQTMPFCLHAGASFFVSTSYITDSENPLEQYKKLKSLV